MDSVNEASVKILSKIEAETSPADREVRRFFRKHPQLSNPQRAQIARKVHGVRCHLLAIDYQLSQFGIPKIPLNQIGMYSIMVEKQSAPEIANQVSCPALAKLNPSELSWPDEPDQHLSTRYSIPYFVARNLISQLGFDESSQLAAAMNVPGPITIRTRKTQRSREQLISELEKEGSTATFCRRAKQGLHFLGKPDIRGSKLWQSGAFEVQDEGSQLIAEALQAQPGEKILDLCAGAGGKTLALADHIQEQGIIYAADIDEQRLRDLKVRLGRTHIKCVTTLHLPDASLPSQVDRVLVDAPCSSTGTWRRGPDRKWQLSQSQVHDLLEVQGQILQTGWSCLKAGGTLVYATCSILSCENEARINSFLDQTPSAQLESQESLFPHRDNTDGFFIAKLRKLPN